MGDDGHVRVDGAEARFIEQVDRLFEQQQGGNALVGWVAVREMFPDVAQGGRAQEGVRQGVEGHVRVRMAEQALFIGDLDAAENELSSFHQAVGVIAGAYAESGQEKTFSHTDVLRGGQFDVVRAARDQVDLFPDGLHQGGVVGQRFRRRFVRPADQGQAEALGRLHPVQVLAGNGFPHQSVRVSPLEGVAERHGGRRGPVGHRPFQHPADGGFVHQRPGPVVNQHIFCVLRQQRQSAADGGLPAVSPRGDPAGDVIAAEDLGKGFRLLAPDHGHQPVQGGQKGPGGMDAGGDAAQGQQGLISLDAHPGAAAAAQKNSVCAHVSSCPVIS